MTLTSFGRLVVGLALITGSCAGPSVLVLGESVRDPGPPLPRLVVFAVSVEGGSVVTDAAIAFNGDVVPLDETGAATTPWYERPITVRAEAAGYAPNRLEVESLPEEGLPVTIALDPIVLEGTVSTAAGTPVQGALVTLNELSAVTGAEGKYRLVGATEGLVTVRRAAWVPEAREWEGSSATEAFVLEPRMVRALRITYENAGNPALWAQYLEMAAGSDVNAFVLDTKDEAGIVPYEIESPTAVAIGSLHPRYDARQALADMKAADLYAITRIVTFQDGPMAAAFPELASRNTVTGGVWKTNSGRSWMDPTDRGSWEYPLELAVAACQLGFDEIQFDYVRFPSDGPIDELGLDGGRSPEVRVATIAAFLTEARARLNPLGCAVAADVFAITISSSEDEGVGQRPEELSQVVDVLSPMIYPTHYADGWGGFENPNDFPAEVVGGALDDGLSRLLGSAVMRPWLQTSTYGATEVGLEVDEATARGLGWMLWSSTNIFDPRELTSGP